MKSIERVPILHYQSMMGVIMKAGIIFAVLAFVINASAAEYKRGVNVQLTGKYADTLFAAGRQINADFDSTDDVFVAGRDIFYSGRNTENLFMAGGSLVLKNPRARMSTLAGRSISITSAEFQDLIAAGAHIRITDTRVADDATMSASDIVVDPNSSIGGSLTMNGGNIVFNGVASQDAVINGGDVVLAGNFLGNVRVNARTLQIGPSAVIQGNLSHAVQNLEISPTATIQGSTVALNQPRGGFPWAALGIGAGILVMIGSMLVPAFSIFLFPRLATDGRGFIRAHFWESLGKGLVTLILIPLVLFLLFSSIIGLPVGMASLPFIAAGTILAWSISVFTVGDQLRIWLSRGEKRNEAFEVSRSGRFWWTALGAFALSVIMAIPVVGFLFCFILFFAGVGSIYAQTRGHKTGVVQEITRRPKIQPPDFAEGESHPSL